ncbi:MAG: hypothetical protein K0S76_479 [Herbinix sp.]|jgi:Rha family phage regulatory protein|nr:hypothetical protein [Herbinix sp.]
MQLGQKTITSVEVAEMVDKQHNELLKDIRRYSEMLGEGKITQSDFFTESTYFNSQNKEQPCYLVTKKGCEFIGNKLTGTKGAIFTAKYINKFNDMQEVIQSKQVEIPQNLLMLQGLLDQMIQHEISVRQATEQSQKAIEEVQTIKETFVETYDNWRDDIKHKIASIQRGLNESYQDTYNRLYDDLEKRAKCDLSARVRNGRRRLEDIGATKSKVEAYCRLDVIEDDTKLKEIFTTIVKEYAVKYAA